MKKIKKILIANRGEIAVRIHRSAKEMGIETVGIFSDPDRTASHVLMCDEAYPLIGLHSKDTYLDVNKIINIAHKAGVDAIHPGYGFLSEKSFFAKSVLDSGFIFIGPSPDSISLLGNKTSARALLKKINVPIVPGSLKPISDVQEAAKVADSIGYPVLIKASGGGGGKGMRKVEKRSELANAIDRAGNEALTAFGDGRIYIEKFIENPKHIEIQILADTHGNVIHLGERECSIQRRHQKIIEECPCSHISAELREEMCQAAVALCRTAGYVNAGTVEFLVDHNQNYFFLEVNTRIQVEHPVTEMVYGIDIVKEQIRIAEGDSLSLLQNDVKISGHSIESRIYAEEADNNFLPSTGKITHFSPSEGPGVRNDSGTRVGSDITMHYDPMIAKLIVHGRNRKEAIAKMSRALAEYKINGVKTTIPFCQFVISHVEFIRGTYDINFVEKYFHSGKVLLHHGAAVAIASAYLFHKNDVVKRNSKPIPAKDSSQWKRSQHDE